MSTLALVMPHPGVLVAQAADKVRRMGALVHEPTRQFLRSSSPISRLGPKTPVAHFVC
jgi:hypothetical protein